MISHSSFRPVPLLGKRMPKAFYRVMISLMCFTLVLAGVPAKGLAQVTPFDSLKEVPTPVPTAAVVADPAVLADINTPLDFKPLTDEIVKDQAALVRLGKALFWDMQVGSDGVQSCASCHFNAG